jgi:peptidoglycan lytic transglycosylase
MYAPPLLAQPALALSPVEIAFTSSPTVGSELKTAMTVRSARLNVLDGDPASVSGSLRSDVQSAPLGGRTVELQLFGGRGWRRLASSQTATNGAFDVRYVPRQLGSEVVRLRFAGDGSDLGAQRRLGRLNSYRLAEASWYGGGGPLACGGWLTSSRLGVASKTLPCGTVLTLRYEGRSLRVPVIDRGPYVAGREFDLTQATKEDLGFGDLGEVWSTR